MPIRNGMPMLTAILLLTAGCTSPSPSQPVSPSSTAAATQGSATACTNAKAEEALDTVDTLHDWVSIHHFYQQYAACDEGGIAEGSAEAVARLLVDRWDQATIGKLDSLSREDTAFRAFVVDHVNTTLDSDDLAAIAQHASTACPADAGVLCRALGSAAAKSLDEQKSATR